MNVGDVVRYLGSHGGHVLRTGVVVEQPAWRIGKYSKQFVWVDFGVEQRVQDRVTTVWLTPRNQLEVVYDATNPL